MNALRQAPLHKQSRSRPVWRQKPRPILSIALRILQSAADRVRRSSAFAHPLIILPLLYQRIHLEFTRKGNLNG